MDWPRRFDRTLRSDLAEGALARTWLADCLACLPEDSQAVVPDIVLAFGEVFTNCVRHAYGIGKPGRVEVTLVVSSSAVELSVRDYGKTLDPSRVKDPDLSQPHEGGYGLFLVRALSDEVEFESPGGVGNLVTLRRGLPAVSALRAPAAGHAR